MYVPHLGHSPAEQWDVKLDRDHGGPGPQVSLEIHLDSVTASFWYNQSQILSTLSFLNSLVSAWVSSTFHFKTAISTSTNINMRWVLSIMHHCSMYRWRHQHRSALSSSSSSAIMETEGHVRYRGVWWLWKMAGRSLYPCSGSGFYY